MWKMVSKFNNRITRIPKFNNNNRKKYRIDICEECAKYAGHCTMFGHDFGHFKVYAFLYVAFTSLV